MVSSFNYAFPIAKQAFYRNSFPGFTDKPGLGTSKMHRPRYRLGTITNIIIVLLPEYP